MYSKQNLPALSIAFDVGHSSIGWAVLKHEGPEVLGCGVVTFGADDCLAKQRRDFRRQRRHVRATRHRIRRLSLLLESLGVLTRLELDKPGCAWPWLLAARVLRGGGPLSWPELWDVIRWYAHNRGYDGNKRWSSNDIVEESEDTEKVNNARTLYEKHGTRTMAETVCAVCGLDPLGEKRSCNVDGEMRPKGLNAAFPREDVEAEVRRILDAHQGTLEKVTEKLTEALLSDSRAMPCTAIVLPERYCGGLLFGQLVPRFENRIIATCPVTFERVYQEEFSKDGDANRARSEAQKQAKVPAKECVEFYRFRWAMQLANVQIAIGSGRETRSLTVAERNAVDAKMQERGYLTAGQFKEAVRAQADTKRDNLDQMLLHPDAHEALVLDPVKKLIHSHAVLSKVWPLLPERLQKRAAGQWRRGKSLTLERLTTGLNEDERGTIDGLLTQIADGRNTRTKKKDKATTRKEDLWGEPLHVQPVPGRAAYTRMVLRAAYEDVMVRGTHPKAEGGVLFRDEAIREQQMLREIDEQTNNHLVRHRLKILDRLHRDVLNEYANGEPGRVRRVTIEVNRELRELSGKTRKEQEQDLGLRLANFKAVTKRLESAYEGKGVKIGPGLIRKARIAEDLGWTCPYTGQSYDEWDLLHRRVDKDHIIPRSERTSDSLDSLVITFAEVNRMKGKRTALKFIEEFQSKAVEGAPQLTIRTVKQYEDWVKALETYKGHEDDNRRKKRRKDMLGLREHVEKEFTPRDLTQTSQLVRLGAQMLQRPYAALGKERPVIWSLPGSVTGATRKGWRVLGCLAEANAGVLDEEGNVRTKTDLRGITHLHHALDACVLVLTAHLIPNNGQVWELLVKRDSSLKESDKLALRALGIFAVNEDGRFGLKQLDDRLKEQIGARLAERRVVQHIPADMSGLRADQTVWRIFDPTDQHPSTHRLLRWLLKAGVKLPAVDGDTALIICRKRKGQAGGDTGKTLHETKTWRWVYREIAKSKLLGLDPRPGSPERLKKLKAVKVLADNYGVALDPEPQIIRFHKVYPQLRELRDKNRGRWPRVLKNGSAIIVASGTYQGTWRVFSTKDNASGMAVDMGAPDVVRLKNRTEGHKLNVRLSSLTTNGMIIANASYVGVAACPTTSSA